ncbi:MAG: response regulator [Acetobacteraceae bacterium]|nr:MAG: response regulator [Acetobacteraceae bacterium]
MEAAAPKGRVLIVDDQFLIVEFLRIWTEACGFEVCDTAKTAEQAVARALEHRPDIVLMDVQLDKGGDGVAAAAEIVAAISARIIFVTASNDAKTLARIAAQKPFATLIKPVDPAELGQVLEQAMSAPAKGC